MKRLLLVTLVCVLLMVGVADAKPRKRQVRLRKLTAITGRVEAETALPQDGWCAGSGAFYSGGAFLSGPSRGAVGIFNVPASSELTVRFGVDGNGHYPLTMEMRVDDGPWVVASAASGQPSSQLNPYAWWSTRTFTGLPRVAHTVAVRTTSYQLPLVDYIDWGLTP